MMTALKNFLLNLGWMFKIIALFFAALTGIALLFSLSLSVLHLATGEKVPGEVLESQVKTYIRSNGTRSEHRTLVVSYMEKDRLTTASISPLGHYVSGETIPLLLSGNRIKIAYWGELFGLSLFLGVFLLFLILAYWLLSKMKYEPKEWSHFGISWMFKRQD